MKKGLLVGGIIWGIVALLVLAVFVLAMTGRLNIPGLAWDKITSGLGSSSELVKEESFDLTGKIELSIATTSDDIIIKLVPGDTMTVRQYDMDEKNLFTVTESGGALNIEVKQRNVIGIFINYWPRLEIELPASYAQSVKLASASGDITCAEVAPEWGRVTLASNSGAIMFDGGIGCNALNASSSSGEIIFGGALTVDGALSIETNSGTVKTRYIVADSVDIKCRSGEILCDNMESGGAVRIATESGSHIMGTLSCASYEISASSGDLRYDVLSGAGSVSSSSGGISCGSLNVKGEVSMRTSSGDVKLTLAKNQNFELSVATSSGDVRADSLKLYYTDKRGNNAAATVGNGKNGTLDIKTSSGSVSIK